MLTVGGKILRRMADELLEALAAGIRGQGQQTARALGRAAILVGMSEAALRSVSDTALLVAVHRAQESDRTDAHFQDPYARGLAGERGERIARELSYGQAGWPVVARTVFFDSVVTRLVQAAEVACVVNLAAGLDARPYRLDLPSTLRWVEADVPDMLDYKARRLAGSEPRCVLERVPADLTDDASVTRVLEKSGDLATLVLTEGLLVYLREQDVARLSRALAARPNLHLWLLDISGAVALRWATRGQLGRQLASASATHRWAPSEGADYFRAFGWMPVEVRSSWQEAVRLRRVPWWLRAVETVTPPGRRDGLHHIARLVLLERPRS